MIEGKIMKRKNILLLAVVLFSFSVGAHEFWLKPQRFYFSQGEETYISFRIGEQFKGMNWAGDRQKLNAVKLYDPECNIADVTSRISDQKGDSLKLQFPQAGTYMVTLNSVNTLVQQNARDFNNYLKDAGLDEVIKQRFENKEIHKTGKEYYQRSVKTIVQVQEAKNDFCTKQTDLPLDIVPLQNPYTAMETDAPKKLGVRIYFKNEPLKNTTVRIYHSKDARTSFSEVKTDHNGEIAQRIVPEGEWLISCVYMERSTEKNADWQSYWATLTFGFPK